MPRRFTLRTMLWLLTAAAIILGYGASLGRQKERERAAEEFLSANSVGMSRTMLWQPPDWIGEWVGQDRFTHVHGVQIWGFPDAWMPYVGDLPHVRDVHIRRGHLTAAGLEHLSNLKKITDLYAEAPVDDALLKNVRQCRLERLVLRKSDVRGSGFKHLDPARLTVLTLDRAPINDEGLRYVGRLEHLRALFINGIKASEEGLSHLRQLDELETLCLIDLPMSDATCARLPPAVRTLYLRNLPITDAALKHLAKYLHLRQVHFIHTDISPDGADWLQSQLPTCRIRLHPAQGRKNSVGSFSYDTPFLVHPGGW